MKQSRLKELFDYSPDTGLFTRKVSVSSNTKSGDVPSCINKRGYIVFRVDAVLYTAHRLAFLFMTGKFPDSEVDHLNGVKVDNRWVNLKQATKQSNMRNRKLSANNTSGANGVYWYARTQRWKAIIDIEGKQKFLGYFDTVIQAQTARKEADKKYGFSERHGS